MHRFESSSACARRAPQARVASASAATQVVIDALTLARRCSTTSIASMPRSPPAAAAASPAVACAKTPAQAASGRSPHCAAMPAIAPVSTSPMPATAMPGLPRSQSQAPAEAVCDDRARTLQHDRAAVALLQRRGRTEAVALHELGQSCRAVAPLRPGAASGPSRHASAESATAGSTRPRRPRAACRTPSPHQDFHRPRRLAEPGPECDDGCTLQRRVEVVRRCRSIRS